MSRPVAIFSPFVLACAVGLGFLAACLTAGAADLRFTAFDRNGRLQWTNTPVPGVCTVELAETPGGPWILSKNAFATNAAGTVTVTAGIVHLLLSGAGGRTHAGDGLFFYNPSQFKISEGRSVTMDYEGNILICESDWGYVRRIQFLPMLSD